MGSGFDERFLNQSTDHQWRDEPKKEPEPPKTELENLLNTRERDEVAEIQRRIEERRPDLHFIPLPEEELAKIVPGQPNRNGGRFVEVDDGKDLDEEIDPNEERASSIDYEKIFKGDGFDSFDYVYDKQGRYVGVVIPKKDFEEEQRREDNAARFADEFLGKLERRIGHPVSQADTGDLVNPKPTISERLKGLFGKPKRKKIIPDDEYI